MAETVKNTEKYLIFSLLGRHYTFPSKHIGEIAMFEAVYPLPLMPSYVLGVINRYSIPYALFDISLLLFNTQGAKGKMLVLKENIDRIAFLIDDIAGIADVPQEDMLDIERTAQSGDVSDIISASFNWNGSDVFILDIRRILDRAQSEVT
ncbi:MAG: chemotaxis protein CheW [Treponema sp.]|jgi:purine-binding chemotaxis protein CheW|nr:chemotaxis protein CheW [Treponema sp.]